MATADSESSLHAPSIVRRTASSPSGRGHRKKTDHDGVDLPLIDEPEPSASVSHAQSLSRSATTAAVRSSNTTQDAATTKSILRRLASPLTGSSSTTATTTTTSTTSDLRASLGLSSSKLNRYSVLHEMDEFRDPETPDVDISFLEGPANASRFFQRSGSHKLVSAEVRVGSTIDELVPRSSVNLEVEVDRQNKLSRSMTIQKYGQQLAEKTNMIVAVKEVPPTAAPPPSAADTADSAADAAAAAPAPAVDLSFLEGQPEHTRSQNSPNSDESTTNANGHGSHGSSYFYPADPEQPNWKPVFTQSPYIAMLIVLSLILAGVQELLYQRSRHLEQEGIGLIGYNAVKDVTTGEFFCWKYLPTIVMVSYGVVCQVTDYEVKRLEPYYQLAQPTGNTADKSLNLDYVTLWSYFVPFKAMRYRHWAVFVSSLATILATTAAPSLQSQSVSPVKNPRCGKDGVRCGADEGHHGSNTSNDALKYMVHVHSIWSRLLTSCLIIVAILATVLLIQLRRRTSGLLTDPRGVAGIAAMATKSHILTDFHGMDEALDNEIHEKLRNRRYILYKSTIWQGEYVKGNSFSSFSSSFSSSNSLAMTDSDNRLLSSLRNSSNNSSSSSSNDPRPIILRPRFLIAFMGFLCVCLPFIPVITYTKLNIIPNKVSWLPVLIATLIKQLWTTLDFAVKMIEPFHTLSKGNALPESTLTLDYQGTPYGILPLKALLNRHYLVALTGFGCILGDILTVTSASFSLSSETIQSFTISSTLATVIVFFLISSAILVLVRRRKPFMPRQPSTIASILAFIYQSRMLADFDGTERYTNAQMQAMLVNGDKRYALGWFIGRDGRPHCAIDQEPVLSRYVHGISYIKARAPWEEDVGW